MKNVITQLTIFIVVCRGGRGGGNKRKTRGIWQESAEEVEVDGASELKLHRPMEATEANILAELKDVQDNLEK